MGSVVTRDVAPFHLVVGSPAALDRDRVPLRRAGVAVPARRSRPSTASRAAPRAASATACVGGAVEELDPPGRSRSRRRERRRRLGRSPSSAAACSGSRSRTGSRSRGDRSRSTRPRRHSAGSRARGACPSRARSPIVWDRHYHVTLLSDSHTRGILAELGLDDEIEWVKTRTGYYSEGRLSSVSNSLEFLRLPALNLVDKLRLGATIWYGSRVTDWRRLEQIDVETWLRQLSGGRAFRRFWLPQLRAKLGDAYTETSAAFLWATIQRLYAARRSGLKEEMFGYVPGGYARVLERFGELLRSEGVQIELATPVAAVESVDGRVEVTRVDGDGRRLRRRRGHRGRAARGAPVPRARAGGGGTARAGALPGHRVRVARAAPPACRLLPHLHRRRRAVHDGHRDVGVRRPAPLRRPHARLPPEVPAARRPVLRCRRRRGARPLPARARAASTPTSSKTTCSPSASRGSATCSRSRRSATPSGCRPCTRASPGSICAAARRSSNGTLNVDEAVALAERAARRLASGVERPRGRSPVAQQA